MIVQRAVMVAALAVVAAGCGYKGPLTLPEKTGPVVTRPARTPATSTDPSTGATPATSPEPVTEPAPPGDA